MELHILLSDKGLYSPCPCHKQHLSFWSPSNADCQVQMVLCLESSLYHNCSPDETKLLHHYCLRISSLIVTLDPTPRNTVRLKWMKYTIVYQSRVFLYIRGKGCSLKKGLLWKPRFSHWNQVYFVNYPRKQVCNTLVWINSIWHHGGHICMPKQ